MTSAKRSFIVALVLLLVAALLFPAAFVWSGLYNVGADDAHTRPVYALFRTFRDRSVAARAREIHPPPNLSNPALITQGAGNYAAMCTGCHLAPGMGPTELSRGLYPAPPALATAPSGDPSHHFWVIKHGIKASGMPAWGRSMPDETIWGMVAFIQQLPRLDAARYQALVARSGGHSHGGNEAVRHEEAGAMAEHRHADGTVESHPTKNPPPAGVGEEHKH